MSDQVARFTLMVEELKRHTDRLVLLGYTVFPPASADTIELVEAELGFSLDESIRAFFRAANGLQLRWKLKNSPGFDPKRDKFDFEPFDWLFPWEEYLPDTGLVNILPIEETFGRNWKDLVWFDSEANQSIDFLGVQYDRRDFKKNIKPFDLFSKAYSMAFFVGDRDSNLKVILGEDHNAYFTSSKVTDFESYIEFLIATKGVVVQRKKQYSAGFNSAARPTPRFVTHRDYWTPDKVLDLASLAR
jgi:hypothetical protein